MGKERNLGEIVEIDEYRDRKRCENGISLPSKKGMFKYFFGGNKIIKTDFRRGSLINFPVKEE